MLSRRDFLQRAAMLSGGLGALAAIPPSILKALEIEPAAGSTFMDAEHVVILMQENRSFDHAFGTLRGVRGYEDPRAITQPGGNPVWLQTDREGATYAPFGLNIHDSKATWMNCLPHDRGSQVAAGNHGKHDHWLKAKRSGHEAYAGMPLTLGYYDRSDIPFYHAFADAFTICDQHFCSAQTCTTPNRLFLWTGTNRDPRDPQAPPRLDNDAIDHGAQADWMTFPERLEDHGVSWRIYQNEIDLPTGLHGEQESWLGNFGDNPMEYFSQYRVEFSPAHVGHLRRRIAALSSQVEEPAKSSASPKKAKAQRVKDRKALAKLKKELQACSAAAFAKLPARERSLHQKAFTTNTGDPLQRKLATLSYRDGETDREVQVPAGDVLDQFRKDVDTGGLPAVSWLVAPENFSDHPSAPWYGAWYVSEVLEILTRNPEVWKKTIFILTYDENDGYYDHVPPFVPPHPGQDGSGAASPGLDTAMEFDERDHAIGLGYRVPMVIASPWSRGGQVCSQVFDHTSVLRFLEVFLAQKASSPIVESNISAWRRTVCGDLTSAFGILDPGKDVARTAVARDPFVEQIHRAQFNLPPSGYRSLTAAEVDRIRADTQTSPLLPRQEPGSRPSRALPYELHAEGRLDRAAGSFRIAFEAASATFGARASGAPFQVYAPGGYQPDDAASYTDAPFNYEHSRRWSFAVTAGDRVGYAWPIAAFEDGLYHLRTYGPNGFYREYRGTTSDPLLEIACSYTRRQDTSLVLTLSNQDASKPLQITISDLAYGSDPVVRTLPPGGTLDLPFDLTRSFRWYDLGITVEGSPSFGRRYAGRVETGEDSQSDPLIGRRAAITAGSDHPGNPGERKN